jgi:hypothetical protein
MATIKLSDNGQTLTLPDDIAGDDERLRNALKPFYPELANAEIRRETKDDTLTVTVVKRAGPKGAGILPALLAAPEELNPALALAWQLEHREITAGLELTELVALQPAIEQAIEAGEAEVKQIDITLRILKRALPVTGSGTPHGL